MPWVGAADLIDSVAVDVDFSAVRRGETYRVDAALVLPICSS